MRKSDCLNLFLILSFCLSTDLLTKSVLSNQPGLIPPAYLSEGIFASPTQPLILSDHNPVGKPDVSSFGLVTSGGTDADFALVLIPDTQNESQKVLTSMTNWIVAQKNARNIVFVSTTGDMVNISTSTAKYNIVDAAMDILDPAGIPYSVGVGNHDYPTTNFNSYFGITQFSGKYWYGGHYSITNDNSYSRFSASGMDFIFINLEYNPSSAVLTWAGALLKSNSDRRAIVVSHSILNCDNSWTNEGIYTALKNNPNLFLLLCGHMHTSTDGAAYRSELGDDGHIIHIMMADYQDFPNGGNGYLRILRFSPTNNKIYATTYSPYLGTSITTFPDQMEMVYVIDVIPTGFEKLELSKSINLYPNPTNGLVTLSIKGEKQGNIIIDILNIKGQIVKTEKMEISENQIELSLKGLPKGTYFIKIVLSGNTIIRKIILQ